MCVCVCVYLYELWVYVLTCENLQVKANCCREWLRNAMHVFQCASHARHVDAYAVPYCRPWAPPPPCKMWCTNRLILLERPDRPVRWSHFEDGSLWRQTQPRNRTTCLSNNLFTASGMATWLHNFHTHLNHKCLQTIPRLQFAPHPNFLQARVSFFFVCLRAKIITLQNTFRLLQTLMYLTFFFLERICFFLLFFVFVFSFL